MKLYRVYDTFNFLLIPLSFLYRLLLILYRAIHRYGIVTAKMFEKKIVSVGNLTVGGTGKTPFVIFLTELLERRNKKVAVVSRGYKRRTKNRIIDLMMKSNKVEVGDEPWLISTKVNIPVVVSRDKREGCSYVIDKYEPDIVILDDGFQSFAVKRDIDILLLDATDNFIDSFLLPAGRLREPLCAIKRADIVVITRCDRARKEDVHRILKIVKRMNTKIPIFLAIHRPLTLLKIPGRKALSPLSLKRKRLLSLSSIGNNRSFLLTLKSLGLNISYSMSYLDHHRYSNRDIKRLKRMVKLHNIDAIITTEKDIYSLRFYVDKMSVPLYLLPIEFSLKERERFEVVLKGMGVI